VHLDEFAGRHQIPRQLAIGAKRRDEGRHHDQSGIDEQLRHLGDAADVFHPIGIAEAEIAVEPMAHVVAVEQIGVAAAGVERAFERIGQRRFAGPTQTGKPDHAGPLVLQLCTLGLGYLGLVPGEIGSQR
jgi:hypothetical protein